MDPLGASASVLNPQSFNRYSYVNNNPTNLTDPSGMMTPNPATGMVQTEDESYARMLQGNSDAVFQQEARAQGKGDRTPAGMEGKAGDSIQGTSSEQNLNRLSSDQIESAKSDIQSLLGSPKCQRFTNGLLKRLGEITDRDPYSTEPLIIFEEISRAKGGGLFLLSGSGIQGASTGGTLEQGTVNIRMKGLDRGPFSAWMNGRRWLHEITHGAPKTGDLQYSHTEMAQAAFDLTRVGSRAPRNDRDSGWKLRDEAASMYFEERLFDACRRH